jgi:hypothetical protein
VFEGKRVHHCGEKQDQHDLDDNVETDPDPANFNPVARTRLL